MDTSSAAVVEMGTSEPSIGAQDAVLLTTELLTSTLRWLPTKDLLLSEPVSRKWRAVITESLELQQALFLISQEPAIRWLYEEDDFSQARRLARVDPTLPLGSVENGGHIMDCGRLNDLLFQHGLCPPLSERAKNYAHASFHAILPLPGGGSEASWRRMGITQPPLYELTGRLYPGEIGYFSEFHSLTFGTGTRRDGITFIEIIARLNELEARPAGGEWTYLPFDSFGNLMPMEEAGEAVEMKELKGRRA